MRPKRLLLFISISAIILAAALLIHGFFVWNSLEKDVRKMLGVMMSLESMKWNGEIFFKKIEDLVLLPLPDDDTALKLYTRGKFEFNEAPDADWSSEFSIISQSETFRSYGFLKKQSGTHYLELTTAPVYGDVDLRVFENKWLAIPEWFSLRELSGKEVLEKLNPEDWLFLEELISEVDLVFVQKTDLIKIIDGRVSVRYLVRPNLEGLRVFLITLWEMQHRRDIDFVSYSELEEKIQTFGGASGELWIEKETFRLRELHINTQNFEVKLSFDQFNDSVDIDPPSLSSGVEKIMASFGFNVANLPGTELRENIAPTSSYIENEENGNEPSSLSDFLKDESLDSKIKNKAIDTDHDGLVDSLEGFYGSDPLNTDTDGDGVSDGEEVSSGRSPTGSGSLFSFGLGN